MTFSRRHFVLLLCCALLPAGLFAARAKPEVATTGGYKGAIVVDATSGKTLFEDNPDLVNPPASMTKLMTFAVLADKLASGAITLDTSVTVNRAEARFAMKRDSTSVWLKEKETFPVEELIYAMMVQSANDAALALSRAAAGSPEAFVELMNAKARELGMTRSTFRTPHGLTTGSAATSSGDLTTPRDFALLCRHLLLHTDVLKYTSVVSRPFGASQRTQPVLMHNHNHLLGKINGVDGLKTGYTIPAGFCLATTVQRNGRRLVLVTLGGTDSKSRDLKVSELIERGFAALPVGSPPFVPVPAKPAAESPIASVPSAAPATAKPAATTASTAAPNAAAADEAPGIKFALPPAKR